MEQSLIIIKPNAVQRELVGELIARFERRGIKITAMKMIIIPEELARFHYSEHKDKDFFQGLLNFITSGPSVIMVLEADHVIEMVRTMVGNTNPTFADTGTIRGDFATSVENNMIHASDSIEAAEKEVHLFFDESELLEYTLSVRPWL